MNIKQQQELERLLLAASTPTLSGMNEMEIWIKLKDFKPQNLALFQPEHKGKSKRLYFLVDGFFTVPTSRVLTIPLRDFVPEKVPVFTDEDGAAFFALYGRDKSYI